MRNVQIFGVNISYIFPAFLLVLSGLAILIILGLYATLWGKEKEKQDKLSEEIVRVEESIEIRQEK
jgi:sensor domain CHASE-containing protein